MKMKFEDRRCVDIIARLDETEEGYVLMVEDKDDIQEYPLNDILKDLVGNVIKISSEVL